jgi:hypothetical protein
MLLPQLEFLLLLLADPTTFIVILAKLLPFLLIVISFVQLIKILKPIFLIQFFNFQLKQQFVFTILQKQVLVQLRKLL